MVKQGHVSRRPDIVTASTPFIWRNRLPDGERGDDILLFIDCFLRKFTSKYQRQEIRIHEQTVEKLRSYHWPGNIRELQHTIEKAVILCEGSVIRPKDILVKQTWQPQATATVPNLEEVEQRRAIETADPAKQRVT